jgi:hypothetical protein
MAPFGVNPLNRRKMHVPHNQEIIIMEPSKSFSYPHTKGDGVGGY